MTTSNSTAPFPVDAKLTGIAIAHKNPDVTLIADQVLPRVPDIGVENYKYFKYDLGQGYTVPDLQVGRLGQPNRVEFKGTETAAFTKDYGLDAAIPQKDIDEAQAKGLANPVDTAVNYLTGLVKLGREVRVARLVQDPNNFLAGYKVALVGTDKFSDYDDSDPISVLDTALNTPIVRPNVLAMSKPVWSVMKRHPKLIAALYGVASQRGSVRREDLADELEVQEILVGEARINGAKPGQAVNLGGCWGPHITAFFRDRNAGITQGGVTFGVSVPRKGFQAGSKPDSNIGVEGGQLVRAWESIDEVIVAPEVGYLIQNVL